MGQGKSVPFSYQLQECLCNKDAAGARALLSKKEFESEPLEDAVFAELVERQWEPGLAMEVARRGNDGNLATLAAAAVLHTSTLPLDEIFGLMKDPAGTIAARDMKPLFMVACDHEDVAAVKALITHQCFNPADARALNTAVRRQLNRTTPNMELLDLVMDAVPDEKAEARYLLENAKTFAKNEGAAEIVSARLKKYLGEA